jgi:NADH-quinone oxidoreductase subunit D
MDRIIGVGSISAEKAINYGFTGPNLRATGVDYDVRTAKPYSSYEDFDFAVPVGESGDTYDRWCVRCAEIKESLKIIRQARDNMPEGCYHADVPDYYLPPKDKVYTEMESLIRHFKIVMGEVPVPVAEVYHSVEAANGELGIYLITDGSRVPYRVHFRRPCFVYYQAFAEMIKGGLFSDAVATLSSINVIAGELDA